MEKKLNPEREGDFNREDSDTAKRPGKSSTQTEELFSSPFARDKRPRIRRVTEQLNERAPRPRFPKESEEGGHEPYRREGRDFRDDRGTPQERRDYRDNPFRERREEGGGQNYREERDFRAPERRYEPRTPDRDSRQTGSERRPDHRSGGEGYDNRRHSYNPNFDGDNRPRRPAPRRYEENAEEDNRFNSYHYDREQERPQRESRPRYGNDRNDRQFQGSHHQGYERDGGYNRENRGYGPDRDNRGGNRGYQGRTDRNNRPNYGDRRQPQRPDNRQQPRKQADPFRTPKGGYDSQYKPKIYPAFSAANLVEPIRLNKFISMSGLCSRREADEFIKDGKVTVNGQVVTEMGVKVNPSDEIRFDGEMLQGEKRIYILMNKPKGFVTTVEDPNADRTVMDIVKNACKERVYPVGRLDKNSLGVLLITNDGELTKKLTHPSHEKQKVYQVTLDRPVTQEELSRLLEGVELDDGIARADQIDLVGDSGREVGIVIHTGRNRIVRRMFEELGYHVQKLDRVYFAGLTKKGLRRGGWRYLTPKEVAMLKSGSYE